MKKVFSNGDAVEAAGTRSSRMRTRSKGVWCIHVCPHGYIRFMNVLPSKSILKGDFSVVDGIR